MKRLFCLLLCLMLLLCACGSAGTPASSGQPTVFTAAPSAEPTSSAVPEVCQLYYDYAELAVIVPEDSDLPLAADAARGAPRYVPLWHNGEYS